MKNKRYLSGIDWLINSLDNVMKTTTRAGNMSQIVFMLDSAIDEADVRDRLSRFAEKFPVLHGEVRRDFTLAPYWSVPERTEHPLNFNVYHVRNPVQGDVPPLLYETINRPFTHDNEYLAFHLVYTDDARSYLAMTFDHRIFDARGAEAFLDLFQQSLDGNGNSGIIGVGSCEAAAALSKRVGILAAGRNIHNSMVGFTELASLPMPVADSKKDYAFRVIPFGADESEMIHNNSMADAGYLMEMPYLLSVTIQNVHDLFVLRGVTAEKYLIPVSIDMRSGADIREELFFNHLSFLFFQIHADIISDSAELIKTIKQQMYEQVESRCPWDIMEISLPARMAPLPVLGKMFRLACKEKLASFCFSYIGRCSYQYTDIMGSDISNLFHMPRVPSPPGLGFFFNHFNGRMNLVISYLEGLIRDEEVGMLESGIRERLGVLES